MTARTINEPAFLGSPAAVPVVSFPRIAGGKFKLQNPKSRETSRFKIHSVRRVAFVAVLLFSFAARGQDDTNEIPQLRPPHAEIPPTFFEQHGGTAGILGVALVAVLALVIWLLTRPKPPVVVSPEDEARKALNALPARAADGATLSRISQILRRYVRRAFDLPEQELTTTEFCRVIGGEPKIGPELAAALSDYLRDLDVRKFAPAAPSTETRAADAALALIDQAEARRERLRAAASATVGKPA